MIRRPPRSTPLYSSAASDVYKRQVHAGPRVRAPSFPSLLAYRISSMVLPSAVRRPRSKMLENFRTLRTSVIRRLACCGLLHDLHNRVLHFLRHPFKLWRIEQRQKSGWFQGSQNSFAALFVNGDPAWQRGGDAHVLIENPLRLLRLTDLEDQTFGLELHALLRHGLLEVVDLHDAKVIGLDGSVQGNGSFAHGFVSG